MISVREISEKQYQKSKKINLNNKISRIKTYIDPKDISFDHYIRIYKKFKKIRRKNNIRSITELDPKKYIYDWMRSKKIKLIE